MTLDTALDEAVQERFEQAIRDVIAGVSQTDGEALRDLPGPAEDLDLSLVPSVGGFSVSGLADEDQLVVSVYLEDKPTGATPLVPDEVVDPAYELPGTDLDRSPTYLGELGGDYARLSDAVVETLATYCDAPSYAPERVFVGEEADLLCTSCYGELVTFSAVVAYPEYVEAVYGEGRRDLAMEYGLPY